MKNSKKTIGIIGGMGPAATVSLYKEITDRTEAACDNEHIHVLIDSYPQIPDRTEAILNNSDAPVPYITEAGKRLIDAGAELLLIPCNTSHYFFDKIQKELSVSVINMIEQTAKYCAKCGYDKVGVLATDGTIKTGVYERELIKLNIEPVYPSDEGQAEVMSVIYDQVKAGKPVNTRKLALHLAEMENRGAKAFILGCTELPLAISDGDYGYKFINTIRVLAESGIRNANYKIKEQSGE